MSESTPVDLLQIGDKVSLQLNTGTAYYDTPKGIPNGTPAVVCGFSDAVVYVTATSAPMDELEPGIYSKRSAALVLLQGKVFPCVVKLLDQEEEQRRFRRSVEPTHIWVDDLPVTMFQEGDIVWGNFGRNEWSKATVHRIIYNLSKPRYAVTTHPGSGIQTLEEHRIMLIKRSAAN